MSTGTTILIAAIVIIAVAAIVALVLRAQRRKRQASAGIGLPDLGALSESAVDTKQSKTDPETTSTATEGTPRPRPAH